MEMSTLPKAIHRFNTIPFKIPMTYFTKLEQIFQKCRLLVKREVKVNVALPFAQPQQKLQLHYKTTITQNCQKIESYGSPTTKKLKN